MLSSPLDESESSHLTPEGIGRWPVANVQFERVLVQNVESCAAANRKKGFLGKRHFIHWAIFQVGFPTLGYKPHLVFDLDGWSQERTRSQEEGARPKTVTVAFDRKVLEEVDACVEANRSLGFHQTRQLIEWCILLAFQVLEWAPRPDFKSLQAQVPARGKWRLP